MKLLRNLVYLVLLVAVLLIATAFAALNPNPVLLDLAVGTVEVQVSLAMIIAFGAGWLFGLLCAALALLRAVGERRRLRRAATMAEAEVRALRSLPGQAAD
jgi:uncharacterized membrane protein YciS (DUF1049 family)